MQPVIDNSANKLTSRPSDPGSSVKGATNIIALVGRQDQPTDALRDYCYWLGRALEPFRLSLELVELNWDRDGFWNAFSQLNSRSKTWNGRWVLMQYTALSWSRRGFSFGILGIFWLLQRRGVRCAVVFHDSHGFGGERVIDKLRRACQHWTMRRAYRLADRSIFTIPVEKIAWLPQNLVKATFIPIGANIPEPEPVEQVCHTTSRPKTIAVFGITGGEGFHREVQDIARVIRYARKNQSDLHLLAVGRNSAEADSSLRRLLEGANVDIKVLGVVPAREITRVFSTADVLLFVRGPVTAMRGSAIAGIACGLPIVGYAGPETSFPITEGGLELVPYHDCDALAAALDRVLCDDRLRQDLRRRSLRAHANYFSWSKIAERFVAEFTNV